MKHIKTIVQNVAFGLKLSWDSSHRLFVFKILYSLFAVFTPIIVGLIWKNIINGLNDQYLYSLVSLVAVYIILKIIGYLLGVVNEYLINRYYDARSFYIENIIISKLSHVNLAYFDSSSMGDRIERIKGNMGMLHDSAWQVFDILMEIINMVTTFIILSSINPIFGIINILLIFPSFIANQKHSKKMYTLSLSQTRDNRLMGFYTNSIMQVDNQSEIKLNQFSCMFLKKADSIWRNLFKTNRKQEIDYVKFRVLFSLLYSLGPIITLLVSVTQASAGLIGIGDMQFYFNTSNTLQSHTNAFFQDTCSFLINNTKIEELRTFIEEHPESESSGRLELYKAPKIEFENVTFSYPNSQEAVLKDCSFVISPNERIALVGLNGAGKSTILKLLFGFYYPNAGRIKLNDIDIREYDIYSVRKIFGVLFQDYVEYCLPLREIISLPCFEKRFDEDKLNKASDITGLSNVIMHWEEKYDTVLGRYYASNGKDLSGGQWQLLCLTRAYFQNSFIMVFDEPSASLDPISEKKIFDQLYDLSFGKGSIIITHQLSNIRFSDRILFLNQGRIVESGTHDELIKKSGIYSKLYCLQSSKYT